MPSEITYVVGDATDPQGEGPKVIAHICNDAGVWGAGFVLAISKRWPEPEANYREWNKGSFCRLGAVRLVRVSELGHQPGLWVANMVAQHGIRPQAGAVPIRYYAVRQALATVGRRAKHLSASVHMPRIGCGLAGGEWDRIEPLIALTLLARDIDVTVYDLEETPDA